MFYIDWYIWPLLATLAIAEIGRGTRDLKYESIRKNQSEKTGSRIVIAYIELLAGLILLIPATININELAFLAFFGSIIALLSAIARFNPIQEPRNKFEIIQGLALITLSVSIILTSLF